jgi:hypothetical protein
MNPEMTPQPGRQTGDAEAWTLMELPAAIALPCGLLESTELLRAGTGFQQDEAE